MGINIVFFFGGLTLLAVFGFESRTSPKTTENPSPFIPTTSTKPTTTSVTSSTSTTGTTTHSSPETTSKSNELHFEMSEWRNGHCEGDGQCPCHWVETRYCQAITSGTSFKCPDIGLSTMLNHSLKLVGYIWFFQMVSLSKHMIQRWINPDLNSNVKSTWKQIRVNGIADADGDVVEAGVTEFGIIADGIFLCLFYTP